LGSRNIYPGVRLGGTTPRHAVQQPGFESITATNVHIESRLRSNEVSKNEFQNGISRADFLRAYELEYLRSKNIRNTPKRKKWSKEV